MTIETLDGNVYKIKWRESSRWRDPLSYTYKYTMELADSHGQGLIFVGADTLCECLLKVGYLMCEYNMRFIR